MTVATGDAVTDSIPWISNSVIIDGNVQFLECSPEKYKY